MWENLGESTNGEWMARCWFWQEWGQHPRTCGFWKCTRLCICLYCVDICTRHFWRLHYFQCGTWRSTTSCPRISDYIYIIRLRGKWIHGHIVDTWTCSRTDSWNMGTVWQFGTDQYAIRHNSAHGNSKDSMRGGSVSLFSNSATPEISSDYRVTGTHGFVLVTYYRALSVIDYVNVTCRALWRVYQCRTWLNTFGKHLDIFWVPFVQGVKSWKGERNEEFFLSLLLLRWSEWQRILSACDLNYLVYYLM